MKRILVVDDHDVVREGVKRIFDNQPDVATVGEASTAGYLTKDSPRSELVKAVDKVIKGGRYISPALAEKLIIDLERGVDRSPHETLSDREFEVMRLIGSGKTVSEIAALLSLSDSTISTYRARILEKMGMKTNAELTHYTIQNKLVT
jgi:DNA-binding NarL/FixJ family response regulator